MVNTTIRFFCCSSSFDSISSMVLHTKTDKPRFGLRKLLLKFDVNTHPQIWPYIGVIHTYTHTHIYIWWPLCLWSTFDNTENNWTKKTTTKMFYNLDRFIKTTPICIRSNVLTHHHHHHLVTHCPMFLFFKMFKMVFVVPIPYSLER